jgi:plastocyanin
MKWIIGAVIVVILAVGAYMLLGNNTASAPTAAEQTGSTVNSQPQADTAVNSQPQTGTPAADGPAVSPASDNPTASGPGDVTTVTLTDKGFSPASVTIKAGQSVMFANDSSGQMWVASGMHPTHTAYDGNNLSTHCAANYSGTAPFDQCSASGSGTNYTFTFTKPGTWKYHNHLNASQFGTIVVTQ